MTMKSFSGGVKIESSEWLEDEEEEKEEAIEVNVTH